MVRWFSKKPFWAYRAYFDAYAEDKRRVSVRGRKKKLVRRNGTHTYFFQGIGGMGGKGHIFWPPKEKGEKSPKHARRGKYL